MRRITILIVLFLFTLTVVSQQSNFGIKIPQGYQERTEKCSRMQALFRNTPKEVGFSVHQGENNILYLRFNNKEWFQKLFVNPYDGLTVDIVSKKLFDCNNVPLDSQIRGELLKPVYGNVLKKNIETVQEGFYRVKLGALPKKFYNKTLEFNMLFLSNRNLCRYQTTYNIQSFNYELLDMGLYLDSISYNKDFATTSFKDGTSRRYKTLEFQIPFKKNKATFSPKDIKPLYDSLRLTDFDIKKIEILAYSSIEGSSEANSRLQKQRSKTMIEALQTFQKTTIETSVSTAENWVEFLEDIAQTKYQKLAALPKAEIRSKVNDSLAEELEVYLSKHRKALVKLYLDKLDAYKDLSGEILVKKFNDAIAKEQLTEAEKIQNSLFHKMKSKETDPELLYQLNIPKQERFVEFFNSNSAFRYEIDRNNLLSAYYEFQEINKWAPKNKKVAYNMLALKLRINHAFQSIPEGEELVQKIKGLKALGVNPGLIARMLVNYHITKSELLMRKGQYEEKDLSVAYILDTYASIVLSDQDYLSLAQYLTYYYDRETAISLLSDKVDDIDVAKNLLFYYLNLTIIDDDVVEDPNYRRIMLNAVNSDKSKFCKIFDSSLKGGVTFQLLDNAYLKRTFCENCSD